MTGSSVVTSFLYRWRELTDWLRTQRAEWRDAWQQVRMDSRRGETVSIPLEEYCVLLEGANREAKAQEKIRERLSRMAYLHDQVMKNFIANRSTIREEEPPKVEGF